jgi:hypothetical protein
VFTLGPTAQATLENIKTEITKDEKLLIAKPIILFDQSKSNSYPLQCLLQV